MESNGMQTCYSFSWDAFLAFLNSQFFSSMSGALAGAFAGAIAAHRISTSTNRRQEVEVQIRAVNSAIMSAFMICNSLLAMKKQHISKMHEVFVADKARYEASRAAPAGAGPHHFDMDLEVLNVPLVPIGTLTKHTYEKLNLKGRALALVSALTGSLDHLQTSIAYRNSLIGRFRLIFPSLTIMEQLNHYFGLPSDDGTLNKEYSDCVEGIYSYTDDIIYFAALLVSDLAQYGNTIRDQYIKKYGKDIDKISVMSFDNPKAKELMPDPESYKDWNTMFVKEP